MVDDLNNLVRLQKSQIKPVGEMLARAFQDDPLSAYIIPDASRRENMLPYGFEFVVRLGVSYGEVYATSPNLEGIAAWLPSEKANMTLWRMIRNGALPLCFRFGKQTILRQSHVFNFTSSMHKRHAPFRHWYLSLLGVDPEFQGKGYASTLMEAMLARIDRERLPCYLETQKVKNVSIYQHYGFKVVEDGIIPGTDIRIWAMLRENSGLIY